MRLKSRGLPLRKRESLITPMRVAILGLAILARGLIWYKSEVDAGAVLAPFSPTSTPTRSARSFVEEAQARFAAGQFLQAVTAYDQAILVTPDNIDLWVGKARALIAAYELTGDPKYRDGAILNFD
ncbi:MAG TPA: hypothetical protein PK954_02660, partial [Anaerolineales bacterium]|nr:hypothetical protein [Anaerolineales bacterium]